MSSFFGKQHSRFFYFHDVWIPTSIISVFKILYDDKKLNTRYSVLKWTIYILYYNVDSKLESFIDNEIMSSIHLNLINILIFSYSLESILFLYLSGSTNVFSFEPIISSLCFTRKWFQIMLFISFCCQNVFFEMITVSFAV